MERTIPVTSDLFWVGGNDRRIALFENVFPVPRGVSYNAYLLLDDKTVLVDTVDHAVAEVFFENLTAKLDGRSLDYVIVQHMEPDHAATLDELIRRYPNVCVVANAKSAQMIRQYFNGALLEHALLVKEGDTLGTGRHTLTFVMAPMVHWPEVMVTYDLTDKILFSADAFGTFGALGGNLFADEVPFESAWLPDARRYYTNIVGKYGAQVQALLKKASALEIAMICPLHGPVWRKNIAWFIEKYQKWSTYEPEEQAVMIAYASVYGHTQNAAEILSSMLAAGGIRNVAVYDVSATHPSELVAEAFRCSHLVFASTTYNAGIFCNMETLLTDLRAHNLQNRTVALLENGSWAPTAGSLMRTALSGMKNMTVLDETVTIRSALKPEQHEELQRLADAILASMPKAAQADHSQKIEPSAMFKLSYGLFVLTAKGAKGDNGCIINTVIQATDAPKRIAFAVNKANYTHDLVLDSGVCNVSILSTEAPFKVFQHFGFQSGRDVNKFADCETELRSGNGLLYLPKYANAFLSAKVISAVDYGTHTLFVADVTEAKTLSAVPSMTYQYYFDHVKPKPKPPETQKKGFVCKICGYVFEGETLPPDFICPLCKHGAEDFEPIG